ncbi:hypothetical protein [Actinokineospora inagensis]|uniref:hypothetical protein n=1 Tax=Actinokineospora inagensis TaxID=103730 RepID=UPI0012F9048C|nr:hypothetical protein [Actinokineospora inagensis]
MFWVERAKAAEYGGRVESHVGEFDGVFGDISPVGFACVAWRLAVPPVSIPGYVRWHRRILDVTCARSEWDGTLTTRVSMVSPWPAALDWPRDWTRDRNWRGWPSVLGQFVHPTARDLTTTPRLRASLLVEAPLPFEGLPPTPESPADAVAETARRAVAVLVRELDSLLGPIVAKLDEAPARR